MSEQRLKTLVVTSIILSHDGRTRKIYERLNEGDEPLLKGPETVMFDNRGIMYALTEEGFLVSLTDFEAENSKTKDATDEVKSALTAKVDLIADLGVGRPLGGKFDQDNTLYIADAHLGLTRLKDPGRGSKVELVASRVFDEGKWTQILYANDVAVGPITGMVYFTDSTDIAPDRIGTRTYDTMFASKMDYVRGKSTGRLLRYNPQDDSVQVLARAFHFPNGIAVDKDETNVYFVETFGLRLCRYSLADATVQVVVNHGMTGYPDGLDCAWEGITSEAGSRNNNCYSGMPSSVVPIMRLAQKIPHPWDVFFRTILLALPKYLAPPVKPYGGVAVMSPESGDVSFIQDPNGENLSMLSGVTVHDNKLFIGSLRNRFIVVYEL